ncbi:MAG TPA: hypothetical protein PLV68_21165, partial [Ilumatobacteraceae bacterium]|nr:hypothetical protein [Ilumatobacteraceae bacterium]
TARPVSVRSGTGALASERFEQLFGTPHGTDIAALATAHGLTARHAHDDADLRTALAEPGPHVTVVTTDRQANVAVHAALNAAAVAAVDAL